MCHITVTHVQCRSMLAGTKFYVLGATLQEHQTLIPTKIVTLKVTLPIAYFSIGKFVHVALYFTKSLIS